MLRVLLMLVCIGFLGLTGCQSAQEREAEANADIAEEKLRVMKKYTDCLEKYEEKGGGEAACAKYKEAAEALK